MCDVSCKNDAIYRKNDICLKPNDKCLQKPRQPVYYPAKRAKATNADGEGRSVVTARRADSGSGRGKVPLAQTVVVGKVYIQRMERTGKERRDAGRPPREPG